MIAGKYRVEGVLGAGGMGVVLAAADDVLERRVAVKLLLPEAADLPGAGARFLREARAAAALESDHIARVLDTGTLPSGAPYLVLEYLVGSDLDGVLAARGPLLLEEAVDYLLQACEAIAEAHARGIIHRDLKPRNIFLTRRADGAPLVKVLDFGLSKVIAQGREAARDASLTATREIMGSIHYMSPEQLRGLKHADARTDVWALGVILYELLTGRLPFDGEGVLGVSTAIVADMPAPASALRRDLPRAVDALIRRCLQKDRRKRVQSVTELARGLAPFGSPKGRLSLEVIERISPESVARAPGVTAGAGGPGQPREALACSDTIDAGAQQVAAPKRAAARAAEAGRLFHTAQVTAWGQSSRVHRGRLEPALLVCAAVIVTGLVALWAIWPSRPSAALGATGEARAAERPAAAAVDAPLPAEVNPAPDTDAVSPTREEAAKPAPEHVAPEPPPRSGPTPARPQARANPAPGVARSTPTPAKSAPARSTRKPARDLLEDME